MKQILKLELTRAFTGKKMKISLLIGFIIVLTYTTIEIINGKLSYNECINYKIYPKSVFNTWIGYNSFSIFSTIYFMIFPLLASFPYGDSLFTDISSGYIKNIVIKGNKKKYWISKCTAIFLSGAFVVVIPLITSLFITMAFFPSIKPDIYSHSFSTNRYKLFFDLFLNHPYVYTFVFFLLQFIFGGLLSCLCIPFTYLVSNKHIVTLCPFALCILIMALTMNSIATPTVIINPEQPKNLNLYIIILEIVIGVLILIITYFLKGRQKDVI